MTFFARPGWTWARCCPNTIFDLPSTYSRVVVGSGRPELLPLAPRSRDGSLPPMRAGGFHPY